MHTIIPGMLKKDGQLIMPFGVMGGAYQPNGHARFVSNVTDFGMDPQAAIDAPGFYSLHWPDSFFPRQAFPGRITIECRVPTETTDALRALGHDVQIDDDWGPGYLSASYVRDDGTLGAAASPRGQQGYAVGR